MALHPRYLSLVGVLRCFIQAGASGAVEGIYPLR